MDVNKLCPGCMKIVEKKGQINFCPYCGYNFSKIQNMPHQLQPYTVLKNRFIVGKVIGQGGFGITYLGYDQTFEGPVAIKEYYPAAFVMRDSDATMNVTVCSGQNPEMYKKLRSNFFQEAKNLFQCAKFPGIVRVSDYFEENTTAYFVMDYVDGIDLREYMKQKGGRIPTEEILDLLKPLVKSLGDLHKSGIIHRDISPDNIRISKDAGVVLLDFGAAKKITEDGDKSQTVMLKHGFAPLEQYSAHGKQGPWTDVYAICATIYMCITGSKPIAATERVQKDGLVKPSKLGVVIKPYKEKILRKGLSVQPEKRYKNAEEFYNAIYQKSKILSNAILKTAVITTVCIVGAAAIAAGGYFVWKNVLQEKMVKWQSSDSVVAETSEAVTQATQEHDYSEADQLVEEAKRLVDDNGTVREAVKGLQDAVLLYAQAEDMQEGQEKIKQAMELYNSAVIKQCDALVKQGPEVGIYEQTVTDIEDAKKFVDQIAEMGYEIDRTVLEEEENYIYDTFYKMYIEKYNTFITEYQWSVRANYEFAKSANDYFASEDQNNPIKLRYAYALAWLVHQENVEGQASGAMNYGDVVKHIEENLEETDYCELLIQDAENYAWISQEGWVNREYYQNVSDLPVIADSSTKEYSMNEIRSLGLSAAELRYARYEIYARHGMQMLWDNAANESLSFISKNQENITYDKFMSYNDFGIYSTDGVNGLTELERENVRNIVKVQLEDGKWLR